MSSAGYWSDKCEKLEEEIKQLTLERDHLLNSLKRIEMYELRDHEDYDAIQEEAAEAIRNLPKRE